jgi:carbamoyltransferase
MYILGISAFYHDSAACIIRDGEIIAAAQEERFSRVKHDPRFPDRAIRYCLEQAGISAGNLGGVAFYEKPALKFDRLVKTYLMYAPRGLKSFLTAMPLWFKQKLWIKAQLKKDLGYAGEIHFPEHHESHAASAFYPSPYESAAFLTIDGVGEWTTTSFGIGRGNAVEILKEIRFPHSLGLLYAAFTYYTGFKVNSGEYKLMGLAPYGDPAYVDLIYDKLIDVKEDGSFRLNMDYFNYCTGFTMTNGKFDALFGRGPREPEGEMSQLDMDLARSIQVVTEEIILKIGRHVHEVTGDKNLCLAGGVTLNCVANGRLLREGPFENIWIQPAAGDAGGALGAALYTWYRKLGKPRSIHPKMDAQKGSYLGPEYSDLQIRAFLDARSIPYCQLSNQGLPEKIATLVVDEAVVGWFQGRMEFGPRALGARSIIGDARSPKMQSVMNLKIKYRESFRPFAPSVLGDHTSNWFDMTGGRSYDGFHSPYMLVVGHVREEKRRNSGVDTKNLKGIDLLNVVRSEVPAITHVDHSARIQTVHPETNALYYRMIHAFFEKTGCPVIINTSFNVRGEPIVESPEDAYRCFMRTEMDYLVMGSYLLDKKSQPPYVETKDWRKEFQLD